MTRYRWLKAEWPMAPRDLAKRISGQEFTEGRTSGFILDRVRDDSLEARFIERYEFTETVSDPYGNELMFDRLEYRQTNFRATSSWPGIEFLDAPRSTQSLISGLLEACDFKLSISPIEVNVLTWANEFQHALGAKALIDSLQVAALTIADGVKAKILFKGEKDVQAACKEMIQGRKHILEKLQLRVAAEGFQTTVMFTNGACAKVDGSDVPVEIVEHLRASIPQPPRA